MAEPNKTINDLFNEMIERRLKKEKLYLELGTVESVDEENNTFQFVPNGGGAIDEANLSVSEATAFIIVPKVDTTVLVGYVNRSEKYLIHAQETDKIVFRSGNNGGLINIDALTTKLNNLVSEVSSLKSKIDTHTHVGVTVGTGVTGIPTPFVQTFTDFDKSDYEDTNITH